MFVDSPGLTPWTGTLSRHKVVLLPGRDTMLHKWVLGLFTDYVGSTDGSFQGLKMRFTTFGVISKYYQSVRFSWAFHVLLLGFIGVFSLRKPKI